MITDLRALANIYRFTREANTEALKLTQTANNLDPDFAAPFALGALCFVQRWRAGWSNGGAEDVSEVRRLARRAIELDKDDPWVLALAGSALGLFVGEVEEGAALLALAISLDPNLAAARIWNGYVQLCLGEKDAAIRTIPNRFTDKFPSIRVFFWPKTEWQWRISQLVGMKKVPCGRKLLCSRTPIM